MNKKKITYRLFILLVLYCIFNIPVIAQLKIHKDVFKEDVKLFTDSDIYIAGEEINLTVITVDAIRNNPVDFSKFVYAELVDFNNQVIHDAIINIENFTGIGSIPIDNSLATGMYAIQIYTQWMRNYSLENISFIKVINPYQNLNKSRVNEISPAAISIFPEGGKLSQSFENKIWFTLSMPDMAVMDMQVHLYEDDSLIKTQKTRHNNAGVIHLDPKKEKNYRVELVDKNNKILDRKNLSLSKEGGVLKAEKNTSGYMVTTQFPENFHYSAKLIHSGSVLWEVNLIAGTFKKDFDFKHLPSGVSYIIITNEKNEILNWRPLIKNDIEKSKKSPIKITNGSRKMLPVKKILELNVEEVKEAALTMRLHREEQEIPEGFEDYTIMTSPEIQQKPMLIEPSVIKNDPELIKHHLSGTLKHLRTGKPAANVKVYMSIMEPELAFRMAHTDAKGNFNFYLEPAEKKMRLLFYASRSEEYLITIDKNFTENQKDIHFPHFFISEKEKPLIENLILNLQVNKAYSTPGKKPEDIKESRNYFFYGKPDESIEMEEYIALPTMEEIFRELSRAVFLTREKGQLKINILDRYENRVIGPDPYVFIDGILVQDHSLIFELDPALVDKIYLMESRYFYGDLKMDGIMDIRTKKGNYGIFENFAFYSSYEHQGISVPSMDETTFQLQTENNIPFYPGSVSWNLFTDAKSLSDFMIRTPDKVGRYMLTMHGTRSDGQYFSKSRIIEVE